MSNPISQEWNLRPSKQKMMNKNADNDVQLTLQNKIAATLAKIESLASGDDRLPIVAVVSQTEKNKVNVSSKAPTGAVDGAVKGVLSGKFLEGLTTMIKGALNTVLGSSFGGEMEKKDFHVVFANNSLVRVDYLIYKYEFSSKGIKKTAKNAFCYYLQVGVLDLEKVSPQVLRYEISRAIEENQIAEVEERLKKMGQFAKDLYTMVPQLEVSQATGSLPGGGKGHESAEEHE